MRIAIAGSTGLVGSALISFWSKAGHQIVRLVRPTSHPTDDGSSSIPWNPDVGNLNPDTLEAVDAVINLAGESIFRGCWTTAKKQRILESRTKSTRLLATTLAKLTRPPWFFFSASAVGYYPSSGDRILTESDPPGVGFLSDVCVAWEAATRPAVDRGTRTVHGRLGVVLSPEGGALAAQLPLFRWGLGGRLGSGKQFIPWIAIDDLVRAIDFCMTNEAIRGPVNLTALEPVTNAEFTKTLGRVLKRPTLLPAPALALRLALGEMAEALLLPSLRVVPERLRERGFSFQYPTLELALRHVLHKPG